MKTLHPTQITDADRPFLISRGLPDGRVELYYGGDDMPPPRDVSAGPPGDTLSPKEFRARFTDPELAGIVMSPDAGVQVLLLKVQTSTEIPMDDPQIAAGLDLLVTQGLLTAARRAVIGA